jgi:hypothetical protein
METAIIVDILRRAGARVIVASVETEHTVGGWERQTLQNPICGQPLPSRFGATIQLRSSIKSIGPYPISYVSASAVTATSYHSRWQPSNPPP